MESPTMKQMVHEFVRQYYTTWMETPVNLHRFYRQDSSFKHRGVEEDVVVSQEQIKQEINQFNFYNCLIKITYVDYQATLGNGIAMQVFGKLSNKGQPLRPFIQSFVLAYQPPNIYYVYNDMFRYKDILGDNEIKIKSISTDNVVDQLKQIHSDSISLQAQQTPKQNGQIVTPLFATAAPTAPITPSFSSSHLFSQRVPATKTFIQTQQSAWKTNPQKPESVTQIQIENIEFVESPIKQEDLQIELVTANETETSSTSLNSSVSTSPVNEWKIKQPRRATTPVSPTISPLEQRENASSTSANTSGGFAMAQGGRGVRSPERGRNKVRGMNRNVRPGPTTQAYYKNEDNGKHSRLTGSNGVDGDRRRPYLNKYSDEQQLFLGNIPTYVTEEELKKFFTKFGNVIDVRIFINRNNNNMPEDRVRNFGFIIFETMESAKSVLVEKKIILSDQNGDHRINVQEKKPRANQAMDGSRIRESVNSMAPGQNDAKGNGVEKNDNKSATMFKATL